MHTSHYELSNCTVDHDEVLHVLKLCDTVRVTYFHTCCLQKHLEEYVPPSVEMCDQEAKLVLQS